MKIWLIHLQRISITLNRKLNSRITNHLNLTCFQLIGDSGFHLVVLTVNHIGISESVFEAGGWIVTNIIFLKNFQTYFLFQLQRELSAYPEHLWRFWIVWITLLSSALFKVPYQWQKMNISEPVRRSKRLFNDGNHDP